MRFGKLAGLMFLTVSMSEMLFVPGINVCCAEEAADEGAFITDYFKEVLDIAAHEKNEKQCAKKVIELSEGKIDFETIARRSCTKKYYNELKAKDPKALEYMKSMIMNTVLILARKYDKSSVSIGKAKVIPSQKSTKVNTPVTANGQKYTVSWVIKKGMIADLICENMSLAGMLKTQFYEYIKKHGTENFLEKCKNIAKAG